MKTFATFLNERNIDPDAVDRLTKISIKVNLIDCINEVYKWFSGTYMGMDHEGSTLKNCLTAIASVYPPKSYGTLYRVTHIHLPHDMTGNEIMKITSFQAGNKPILSWSSDMSGTDYFYKKFLIGVNHMGTPEALKTWVLVSSSQPKVLADFDCLMQFLKDVSSAKASSLLKKLVSGGYYNRDQLMSLSNRWDAPVLEQNKEVICETPNPCHGKVEKILVPPL
jgi:hypothetical protein